MHKQEIENLYGIGTVHTKISELFTEFTEKLLLLVENGGTKSQLLVALRQSAELAHQGAEIYVDLDKVLPKIENDPRYPGGYDSTYKENLLGVAHGVLFDPKGKPDQEQIDYLKANPLIRYEPGTHPSELSPAALNELKAVTEELDGDVEDDGHKPQWVKDAELGWQGEKGTSTQL